MMTRRWMRTKKRPTMRRRELRSRRRRTRRRAQMQALIFQADVRWKTTV